MSEVILEAKNLRKIYKDFWLRPRTEAVVDVSLRAEKGEVVGLLGPNGSGKSTTIKMLLGLLMPTAGSVRLFGKSPQSSVARARIGYLPELSNLHKFLTPRETLRYYAGLFGMSAVAAERKIGELLELVGLAGSATDRPIGEFSKGMARRVGLAQALLNDPDFVILDEPTSGLDPIGRHDVKELIRRLAERGTTILLSSHLLSEVADVCTRVVILVNGRVSAEGDIKTLLEKRSATRFTVEGASEAMVEEIRHAIESATGAPPVVDWPSQSLEDFFLGAVSAARQQGRDE